MTPTQRSSDESPQPVPEEPPERAAEDRATSADHDVPDETVIDKTLPTQTPDKQRPEYAAGDRPTAADRDVPDETVIDKTLPRTSDKLKHLQRRDQPTKS